MATHPREQIAREKIREQKLEEKEELDGFTEVYP